MMTTLKRTTVRHWILTCLGGLCLGATLAQATPRVWTGAGTGSLASTSNNWLGGLAPGAGDSVLFDGTGTVDYTWDLEIELLHWTQTVDYPGTVTIPTRAPAAGGFTNLVIAGDVQLAGGVWTHPANSGGDTAVDRLAVAVFAMDPGSPGGTRIRTGPVSGLGGGAIRLMTGGNLHLDGTLTADGMNGTYHGGGGGSGGSVFVACQRLTGTGTLRANGGLDNNNAGKGGGGRIAVWHHLPLDFVLERLASRDGSGLTHKASLASFGGTVTADSPQSGTYPGEHGTVGFYTQLGTLILLR